MPRQIPTIIQDKAKPTSFSLSLTHSLSLHVYVVLEIDRIFLVIILKSLAIRSAAIIGERVGMDLFSLGRTITPTGWLEAAELSSAGRMLRVVLR